MRIALRQDPAVVLVSRSPSPWWDRRSSPRSASTENVRDEQRPGRPPGQVSNWKRRASAYETGGRPALQAFSTPCSASTTPRASSPTRTAATCSPMRTGRDLVRRAGSGRCCTSIFRAGDATGRAPRRRRPLLVLLHRAARARRRLVPAAGAPFHDGRRGAAVLLAGFHLTSPVRELQKAVERFGRGDLSARAGSTRRDELGQLARTFDRMADRIETLLAAERRLLLDISHELRSPLARLGRGGGTGPLRRRSRCRAQPHPEGVRPAERAGRPASAGDARRGRPELAAPRPGAPRRAGAATGGRFRASKPPPTAAA